MSHIVGYYYGEPVYSDNTRMLELMDRQSFYTVWSGGPIVGTGIPFHRPYKYEYEASIRRTERCDYCRVLLFENERFCPCCGAMR